MNDALAQMDLTASQGHIMAFLSRQTQPPCARDIEEHLQLSHPTVSGLLSRLEKKGFLETHADAQDHRCKRIYLLPKGRECLERMDQYLHNTERRLVEGFTEEEQLQFARLLNRAIRNMGGSPCQPFHKEESE